MVVAADMGSDDSVAEVRVAAAASSAATRELCASDFAEFIIGPRFARTRWLNSGYFPNAAL